MEQQKQYTALDFERYHSGRMTAQEMHALEKAALADPFLADALDGYIYSSTPQQDLAEIRARLATQSSSKKRALWLLPAFKYAATLVVLLGLALLVYQLNRPSKEEVLVSKLDNSLPAPASAAPATIEKNSSPAASSTENNVSANNGSNTISPVIPTQTETQHLVKKESQPVLDDLAVTKGSKWTTPEANSAQANLIRGRVVDPSGNPVPFASVTQPGQHAGVLADANGSFAIPSRDSSLATEVASAGYRVEKADLKKDKEQTIVLLPDSMALTEVVATAYSAKRASQVTAAASKVDQSLAGKAAGVQARGNSVLDDFAPTTGWASFNQYMAKQVRAYYSATSDSSAGRVDLEFVVDRKGRAKNIRVSRSLNPGADATAVRILQQGPKWVANKNSRHSLSIPFNRK